MITGGCLCGAIRYRARGKPAFETNCHCGTCRKASAAPFVPWASFDTADLAFERGEPRRYRSSPDVVRTFCADCGTPLTYQRYPDQIDVTICSMDDPNGVPPRDHTWVSHQLSWVVLGDGLPCHAEVRP
jgi:hypothetical protein